MNVGRTLKYAVGAAAGIGTAVGLYLFKRDQQEFEAAARRERESTRRSVEDRLSEDDDIAREPVRVTALTAGIVELTGHVSTEEASHRVVDLAQEAEGVRTVVNRLEVSSTAEHLEQTRARREEGAPDLTQSGWEGQRVGTGQRRQSGSTDPDRSDDKVPMKTRELGTGRAQKDMSEPLEKQPPAVQDHTAVAGGPTGTGDMDSVPNLEDTEPRDEPDVELNTDARILHDTKPGVEREIEEAGLKNEMEGGAGAGEEEESEGAEPNEGESGEESEEEERQD